MSGTWIAVLGAVVLIALYAVMIYNRLVKRTTVTEEGWSGIDVQLKRRSNLIPNLVETVKGYAAHERGTLDEVTELRAKTQDAHGRAERAETEGLLTAALVRLLAVAENYPDLKASTNFTDLQGQLAEVEDQIQMARRFYNGAVRNLNILVESFPSNLIVNAFKFGKADFFEIEDVAQRAVPEVDFRLRVFAGWRRWPSPWFLVLGLRKPTSALFRSTGTSPSTKTQPSRLARPSGFGRGKSKPYAASCASFRPPTKTKGGLRFASASRSRAFCATASRSPITS